MRCGSLERVVSRRPQNRAAAGQDPSDRTPIQLHQIIFDQSLPSVSETQNLNPICAGAPDNGADSRVKAGTVTACS